MTQLQAKSLNPRAAAAIYGSLRLNDGRWQNSWRVLALKLKAIAGSLLILTLSRLIRAERPTFDKFLRACKDGRPVVIMTWHGSILLPIYFHRRRNLVNMTSLSEDGDLITSVLYSMGYKCVRGSSSRGGMRVLLEMIRLLKGGENGAITVDGPRGPRHQVKPGVVLLAQKTGALLVPLGSCFSHSITLNSWDRTEIPLPGSRAVMITGEPFTISPETDVEHGCELVRDSLFACETAAREYLATGRLNSCIIEKTGGII